MDNVMTTKRTNRAVEHAESVKNDTVVPSLENSKGWDKLSDTERNALRTETQEVQHAVQMEAQSKLAIGEHLSKIQDILGPKRLFVSFVDHNFGWSRATAYRYIDMYKIGKRMLPEAFLEEAIARNTPIREDVLKSLPAIPQTTDKAVIRQFLHDNLENVPNQPTQINTDYNSLLKEAFNFVVSREQRVAGNQRQKNKWHSDFIGMLLTKWGIASPTTFNPIAVPESMFNTRGRPKQAQQQQIAA
jgi:hypothetical protein